MIELQKYTEFGTFRFRPTDSLPTVCNAPSNKAGVYCVYSISGNNKSLVYIGRSGRIDKAGKLIVRKDGIFGRIVKGKRDKELRRRFWVRELLAQKFDALQIEWFVTHNVDFTDCPKLIEKTIVDLYNPKWNR